MSGRRYIVSPAYDWAFFLLPPVLALCVGIAISGTAFTNAPVVLAGREMTAASLCIGVLVHAHLVAVLARSHANPTILSLYPIRFIWVPLLLWAGIASSSWMVVIATVVATFWDVWHSGAQTFGFARIYDRNHGAPPDQARRLDFWLNQLLYAGPILAGATLIDHLDELEGFADLGAVFLAEVPAMAQSRQRYLTWVILIVGSAFLAYYVHAYWRLYRRGYRMPWLKVYLLVSTGACSIYTWGFNTWGEAFFIMNSFHAVQYLALVWATERGHIARRLRVAGRRGGMLVTALVFFGGVAAYGFGVELLDPSFQTLWAVTMVVSLMHFWYDGFIWSVTRKQV